jgi:hypothetical protein
MWNQIVIFLHTLLFFLIIITFTHDAKNVATDVTYMQTNFYTRRVSFTHHYDYV